MFLRLVVIVGVVLAAAHSLSLQLRRTTLKRGQTRGIWAPAGLGRLSRLAMSSTEETASEKKAKGSSLSKADFAAFSVGQQYDAELLNAKEFGIFVDISKGISVLLPKTRISAVNFEKLKGLAEAKSKDKVKIEIIAVNTENQTLTGKFVDPDFKKKERKEVDLSAFKVGQIVKGKVVSILEFGTFVNIVGQDFDALLPNSLKGGMSLT